MVPFASETSWSSLAANAAAAPRSTRTKSDLEERMSGLNRADPSRPIDRFARRTCTLVSGAPRDVSPQRRQVFGIERSPTGRGSSSPANVRSAPHGLSEPDLLVLRCAAPGLEPHERADARRSEKMLESVSAHHV